MVMMVQFQLFQQYLPLAEVEAVQQLQQHLVKVEMEDPEVQEAVPEEVQDHHPLQGQEILLQQLQLKAVMVELILLPLPITLPQVEVVLLL